MQEIEIWKDIPDWPSYEASSLGRIRSKMRKITQRKGTTIYVRTMQPKILSPRLTSNGRYHSVTLSKPGLQKQYSVHTLVLLSFSGRPPSSKHEAAHWDGNSKNNTASNLRWALHIDNNNDRIRHGTALLGEDHPSIKIPLASIAEMKTLRDKGLSYSNIAQKLEVSAMAVWRILNGHRRTAGYTAIAGEISGGK